MKEFWACLFILLVIVVAAFLTSVIVPAMAPLKPQPPGQQEQAHIAASVFLRVGGHTGPATVLGPERQDGTWDIIAGPIPDLKVNDIGTIITVGGKTYEVRVIGIGLRTVLETTQPTMDFRP